MMKYLIEGFKLIAQGIADIFTPQPYRYTVVSSEEALRRDWESVGRHLRAAMNEIDAEIDSSDGD